MEPVSTITGVWSIAKAAGEISKRLFDLGKGLKDRDIKHKVDEIADQVRDLKQAASELEDENRALREKLRFKSDDYEFHTPFYYEKTHPDRPLCPKCFANETIAPMGEPGHECRSEYRRCLACGGTVEIAHVARQGQIRPVVRPYTS